MNLAKGKRVSPTQIKLRLRLGYTEYTEVLEAVKPLPGTTRLIAEYENIPWVLRKTEAVETKKGRLYDVLTFEPASLCDL